MSHDPRTDVIHAVDNDEAKVRHLRVECRLLTTWDVKLLRSVNALLLGLAMSSCGQLERMERKVEQLSGQLASVQERLQTVTESQVRADEEVKTIWSRVSCNNDSVKQFLRTCEKEAEGCTGTDVSENFREFLNSQPYALIYIKPGMGLDSMIRLRDGQLQDLASQDNLHLGTRFIIVVLPASDSIEDHAEAEKVGKSFWRYLRGKLKVPESYPILGPKTLPCNYKREQLIRSRKQIDQRLPGEPTYGRPVIPVWIFRTDCH